MPLWELAEIRPLLPSGAEDAETFAHDNESLADTPSCSFSVLMDALNSAGPAPRVTDRRPLFSSFRSLQIWVHGRLGKQFFEGLMIHLNQGRNRGVREGLKPGGLGVCRVGLGSRGG